MRGRVEVQIGLIGSLEVVRRGLFDRLIAAAVPNTPDSANHGIQLPLVVGGAQRVELRLSDERGLIEQRVEPGAAERALDERRGRADHLGVVELVDDAAGAPQRQRRHDQILSRRPSTIAAAWVSSVTAAIAAIWVFAST